MNTELIVPNTVADIVAAYDQTCADAKTICQLSKTANERMKAISGKDSRCRLAFGNNHYTIDMYTLDDAIKNLRRDVWMLLLDFTNARTFMSEKRYRGVVDQINNNQAPEITEENINNWLMDIATSIDTLLQESIQEVFEWMRPPQSKYVRNSEFEIPNSIVLTYCVEHWCNGYHIHRHAEQRFQAMDNVFHLLDGKGASKYPDDLRTKLSDAMLHSETHEITTEYFRIKWFKNGNAHVWFLRSDLLAKLNARAGGNNLRAKEDAA